MFTSPSIARTLAEDRRRSLSASLSRARTAEVMRAAREGGASRTGEPPTPPAMRCGRLVLGRQP